jgi:hypothetical protein
MAGEILVHGGARKGLQFGAHVTDAVGLAGVLKALEEPLIHGGDLSASTGGTA